MTKQLIAEYFLLILMIYSALVFLILFFYKPKKIIDKESLKRSVKKTGK